MVSCESLSLQPAKDKLNNAIERLDKRALYFIVSSELLKELCLSLIRWFLQSKQGIDQRKSEKYLRIYRDK
ncbi:hypothetical protein DKE50_014210 [Acinetobacter nosocomialis]|nr:hypothetical protein DKE50_014210 [Acinetobacter nosocomialis]AZC10246.1 hypothetical protein DKE47_015345 [Acinetobacter nosocomialis]